jgi:hypothetical protein
MIVIKNLCLGWCNPNFPLRCKQTYNFETHYNQCITCILAREKEPKGLEQVLAGVRRCKPQTIQNVRQELKKINGAKYYKHAPLILKLITGVSPPEIADDLLTQCKMIFSNLMKLQLFKGSGKNSMSYSYIIYKIFDNILPEEAENRKILNYIHLPSNKTLQRLEIEWHRIVPLDIFIC